MSLGSFDESRTLPEIIFPYPGIKTLASASERNGEELLPHKGQKSPGFSTHIYGMRCLGTAISTLCC